MLDQCFSVYEALPDLGVHLNSQQPREGCRVRIKVPSSSYLPGQGFFRKENSGGERELVLWLLRPAAQQGLEGQGPLGWGRVGPRLAEGARADGGHRRGSGLVLDVPLSVENCHHFSIFNLFSSRKCSSEGQCGTRKIIEE